MEPPEGTGSTGRATADDVHYRRDTQPRPPADPPAPTVAADPQDLPRVEPGQSRLKLVVQLDPSGAPVVSQAPCPSAASPTSPGTPAVSSVQITNPGEQIQSIPARMLNEFVYCPRLFYYEFVEGVFVESADTMRGTALHRRVDSGSGAMPDAERSEPARSARKGKSGKDDSPASAPEPSQPEPSEPEVIHSRSVQMGSDRLGVVAKMDLVEIRDNAPPASGPAHGADPVTASGETGDLFKSLQVCPVDYKAGSPREGAEANELWDTDRMQLGLQALILRENGYACDEGIIYYRGTRQRVRLPITLELEEWVRRNIAAARRACENPLPPPLENSPKCARCSLAPVCLPDETRMLARAASAGTQRDNGEPTAAAATTGSAESEPVAPRRLIAARDDTRPLYLNTQGYRVGCKEEVLQVKEKDKVLDEVRVRDLSHVALFGNIQVSTQAVQTLCELEVPLTYFSMGGWFYGITRGHGLKNVFLRVEQFRLAAQTDRCLAFARQFVHGKIRNCRTMLMRNHLEPPEPIILKLKRAAEDALGAGGTEQLLGIEGAAASLYFQVFSGMIKVEDDLLPDPAEPSAAPPKQLAFNFNFAHRNRRPPTDPVNAMLSLAYSLLAKDCTLAALAVGFDPYIGFYHQPRFGRPALGLDLMEEFRPLVAESTVLSCINNRVITAKDFVRAGQAVNLSAAGRKRFFQMYEQRMSSLITHPLFDYKVSYRRAVELQARLLAKAITGELPDYTPLLTK